MYFLVPSSNLYVCVCVCVYARVFMCADLYVYVYARVFMYADLMLQQYTYIPTYIHTYNIHTYIHTYHHEKKTRFFGFGAGGEGRILGAAKSTRESWKMKIIIKI